MNTKTIEVPNKLEVGGVTVDTAVSTIKLKPNRNEVLDAIAAKIHEGLCDQLTEVERAYDTLTAKQRVLQQENNNAELDIARYDETVAELTDTINAAIRQHGFEGIKITVTADRHNVEGAPMVRPSLVFSSSHGRMRKPRVSKKRQEVLQTISDQIREMREVEKHLRVQIQKWDTNNQYNRDSLRAQVMRRVMETDEKTTATIDRVVDQITQNTPTGRALMCSQQAKIG